MKTSGGREFFPPYNIKITLFIKIILGTHGMTRGNLKQVPKTMAIQ